MTRIMRSFLSLLGATALIAPGALAAQPQYSLEDINGTNGFEIYATEMHQRLGKEVAWIGDVNGDGKPDFAVTDLAVYNGEVGSREFAKAYVIFGGFDFSQGVDPAQLQGNNGFAIKAPLNGLAFSEYLKIDRAGDFNGDGIDDFVITDREAPIESKYDAGRVWVVFGKQDTWAPELDLSGDGAPGMVVFGSQDLRNFGLTIAPLGDFDGDGYDDLLAAALNDQQDIGDPYAAGKIFVIYGDRTFAINHEIHGVDHVGFRGESSYAYAGLSVAGGDVNGDGHPDIIIGAPYQSQGDQLQAGRTYVVYGRVGRPFQATEYLANYKDGVNGVAFDMPDAIASADAFLGTDVTSGFDFNGDGKDDILLSAPNPDVTPAVGETLFAAGQVYLVYGSASLPANMTMDTLDGTNGFKIPGRQLFGHFGEILSSAGDVNGDGLDDVVMWEDIWAEDVPPTDVPQVKSAPAVNPAVQSNGEFVVLFGSSADLGASFDLNSINGQNGFFIQTGPKAAEFYTSENSVAGGADLNNDGQDDLLIGLAPANPYYDAGADFELANGGAWVFYGPTAETAKVPALAGAVLPAARSGYVGGPDISVFMTLINGGTAPAAHCTIGTQATAPVSMNFAETDPATNIITGAANDPFGLAVNQSRSFVLGMTPNTATTGEEVPVQVTCDGVDLPPIPGVNGIFLTIGAAPSPDILSISATNAGGGIVDIPGPSGTGFMSVAALNIGVGDGTSADPTEAVVKVSVDTGSANLPLNLFVCETDLTGACSSDLLPTITSVIGNDASTYAVFAAGTGTDIPFDPANNRIYVRFKAAFDDITYSVTSAAVRTIEE